MEVNSRTLDAGIERPPGLPRSGSRISLHFRRNEKIAAASGIGIHEAHIESPGTIGVVERYQAPLRAAFEKIKVDYGDKISDREFLKMSVYATNDTVVPEGYCPILLVYGLIPHTARTTPCPTQLVRINTIENAMREVQRK